MAGYRLRDVFTPGGMPSVTYVKRENLGLERKLKDALSRGHSIITVSGPTKSGKTVLCRTVIPASESIWVEGGRIKDENDFWLSLADELNIADETSAEKGSAKSDNITAGGKAGISVPALFEASSNGSKSIGESKASKLSKNYKSDIKKRCIKAALEKKITIVVDDFHFVDQPIQKSIVNSIKSAIFDGLDVVVIAVPHRAFDPLAVQQEMQGRFIHVEVTDWSQEELELIPGIGFPALNVQITEDLIRKICEEAIGNPLLVQDLCFRLCQANDIEGTLNESVKLDTAKFNEICEIVAENSGFPIFERLSRGPQSRKDRRMRPLKGGGEVDTYQAILLAVTQTGARITPPYDDIRASMREILEEGSLPQKNEVTSACGHMSSIAKNELENVEPIDWHNDALVISDPFLLFYMRWRPKDIWKKLAPRAD